MSHSTQNMHPELTTFIRPGACLHHTLVFPGGKWAQTSLQQMVLVNLALAYILCVTWFESAIYGIDVPCLNRRAVP